MPGCSGEYLELVREWKKHCKCLMSDIPVNDSLEVNM